MRWIAVMVVLMGCGGTAVSVSDPATASAEVLSLGLPCTPSQPDECPTGNADTICGNDRFGWTCVAYCTDAACAEPGTTCMARVGASPDMTGFCWKACAKDADCSSSLRCRDGVCGPRG